MIYSVIISVITNAKFYSLFGLSLDIIGVILLFYHGVTGEIILAEEKTNPYKKYSRLGLYLIVIGFALQFVGTCLS